MNKKTVAADVICGLILLIFSLFPLAFSYPAAAVLIIAAGIGFTCFMLHHTRFFAGLLLLEVISIFTLGLYASAAILSLVLFASTAAVYIGGCDRMRPITCVAVLLSCCVGGVIMYFVTSNPYVAALAFAPLFPLAAQVITLKVKLQRTQAIALITLFLAVPVLIAAAIWLYVTKGAISVDIIRETVEELRGQLATFLATLDYKDFIPIAESQKMLTEENAALLSTMLFNMLPGIVVVILSVAAYFIQKFTFTFICVAKKGSGITREMSLFRMSAVSGIVFVLTVIVNLVAAQLSSDSAALVATVTQNIYMILEPGFIVTGFVIFFGRIREGKGRKPSVFMWFLFIGLAIFMPSAIVLIVAYYGAVMVIYEEFVKPWIDKKKKA